MLTGTVTYNAHHMYVATGSYLDMSIRHLQVKHVFLLKMGGSMDDVYKLDAITDSRLVNLNVQRLQVLTQMPVINAEHFHLNE